MRKFFKIQKDLPVAPVDASFRGLFWARFKKNGLALWSLRVFFFLLFIAIFADFLANDKPIYCKTETGTHFPVLKEIGIDLGLVEPDGKFRMTKWKRLDYESVIWPLIPYSSTSIDLKNARFKSPFDEQRVESFRFRHHLGTDKLGRDVTAGMIYGTRVALIVGLLAMLIASLLGIFFGTLAGWFGDTDYRVTRAQLIMSLLAVFPAFFYGFMTRGFILQETNRVFLQILLSFLIFSTVFFLFYLFGKLLERIPFFKKMVTIPLDLLIMRLIEIMNSIPALLILLAAVAVLAKQSIFITMLIIGFLTWTPIARFVRAELLRIKQVGYIESARAIGLSNFQIIRRHALPNALTPVLITIAFGIAGAILLETTLSFLGIGGGGDEMTWGMLLNTARSQFSAWWLALFPGAAIFVTVTIFNLIGEGLTDALDG